MSHADRTFFEFGAVLCVIIGLLMYFLLRKQSDFNAMMKTGRVLYNNEFYVITKVNHDPQSNQLSINLPTPNVVAESAPPARTKI